VPYLCESRFLIHVYTDCVIIDSLYSLDPSIVIKSYSAHSLNLKIVCHSQVT